MDSPTPVPAARETRALLAAKLARAASLPRMKDGRRPPMHAEAVSEGENPREQEAREYESPSECTPQPEILTLEPEPEVEIEEETPETPTRKRRSRSRTRSRGSRDYKARIRAAQSPNQDPQSSILPGESSPEEPPAQSLPPSPPLLSPTPNRIPARLMLSSVFASPRSFSPAFSPSTPLPTLDALRDRALFRSNSAGGRAVTPKLSEPGSPSPTPPPLPGLLGRNNTVSGGERSAASKNMLKRLQARVKDGDGEQTSGGEEANAIRIPPKPKRPRSRPRSRRASAKALAAAITDAESDFTRSTPLAPPTPLPVPSRSSTPLDAESIQNRRDDTLAKLMGESPKPRKRRSVFVEPEDVDDAVVSSNLNAQGLPATPIRSQFYLNQRIPHSSDAPSNGSTDSAPGSAVPLMLSSRSQPQDQFPSTPIGTPTRLDDVATPPVDQLPRPPFQDDLDDSREEDEEEQFVYAGGRERQYDAFEREISWIADPVPERENTVSWVEEPSRWIPENDYSPTESRMPIDEDDDPDQSVEQPDESYEEPPSATSSKGFEDTSPRDSYASSANDLVESEASPDHGPTNMHSSLSAADLNVALSIQDNRASEASSNNSPREAASSGSSRVYPARLSVASPVQADRSDYEWDDPRITPSREGKREGEGVWGKMKKLARTGSTNGTRSRSNSLIARDRNTDSSISRESAGSGPKDVFTAFTAQQAQQQQPPYVQSPSASGSILSLAPHLMPSGAVSPLPAASPADTKYQNSKLFPFPGMFKLEEQKRRQGLLAASASTPDVSLSPQAHEGDQWNQTLSSSPSTPGNTSDVGRGRKISHQASDTRLLDKFKAMHSPTLGSPSSSSPQYFDLTPLSPSTSSSTLPKNLKGMKKWLQAKGSKSPISPGPSMPSHQSMMMPPLQSPQPLASPSHGIPSEFLQLKMNEPDMSLDWQEVVIESASTPTIASGSTFKEPTREKTPNNAHQTTRSETEKTPKGKAKHPPAPLRMYEHHQPYPQYSTSPGSPPEPPSSATPDPLSSEEGYPSHSTSESSSTTSSYSHRLGPSQGVDVLERLDEMMGSKMTEWTDVIDNPPRKLLISSPVLQVVNANTVKDRFLFLFTDLLVIAKPIIQDHDNMLDHSKPNPMDRKYIVKSVVLLRDLRFNPDRDEPSVKTNSSYGSTPQRHPLVRSFVQQFAKDSNVAVAHFVEQTNTRDDPAVVGRLLFKTLDVDRMRLGDYLSRRSTRAVAKAFIDSFGFTGVRVDRALRVFLHAVNLPAESEPLLDLFAIRWYEANASIIAYDKDLAVRLVRACLQLNSQMHGGITDQPGPTPYPLRNITSRDFLGAFRRLDARGIVSDESLDQVYSSIRRERLSQARSSSMGDVSISVKRPLPPRLTYRVQSEPVVLRIPQVDSNLTIELFGQDLVFDPPTLSFGKSPEASFRVTGTALGSKTIFMHRSGPNALKYTGLPLSSAVGVERAFMRNTFQVAFDNPSGLTRRYMFSVDDPLMRHQWTVSLRREINACTVNPLGPSPTSKFHRAAEAIAFKVLQETLIGGNRNGAPPQASAIDRAIHQMASPSTPSNSYFARGLTASAHVRSKSRSQVYHRHGAGQHELDLGEESRDTTDPPSRVSGEKLWAGRDLEMQCSHNGSIALVLAHLQVGVAP